MDETPSTHIDENFELTRGEREANRRLQIFVGSVYQRGTQMSSPSTQIG